LCPWIGVVALAVLMVVLPARGDQEQWRPVTAHQYVLEMNGAVAGWMKTSVERYEKQFRTRTESFIRIRRGQAPIEVIIDSAFQETQDGRPVRLVFTQDMSQMKLQTEWIFGPASVEHVTKQGARTLTKELPLPEQPWLTPMAIHRYFNARCEAGADEITYRMINPEHGLQPVTVKSVRVGEGQFEFDGRVMPVTEWRTTVSSLPDITSRELYSSDGYMVRSESELGFGPIVTRIATAAELEAAENAPAPEFMLATFVQMEKPIRRVASASAATLKVRALNGDLPVFPAAGAQRIGQVAPGEVTLVIDVNDPVVATAEEQADASFLASSAFADSEDALVKALARRAVRRSGQEPAQRAEAMRKFVYRYITGKDFDTAFASASETAKVRTGDCSEHAVLLCAMLRSQGIPARVAIGLVYVSDVLGMQNVFGWHMWTQALVNGHWIDLDATLPGTYHAGHVLVSTSGMSDSTTTNEMSALLTMLGNIQIEVVDVEYD
jgi:transglutaminase-like putative cysteine protease